MSPDREEVPRHLLRRARRGLLTRKNTAKGSPERTAVYRVERLRRQEHGQRRGLTQSQIRGHARATKGEVPASQLGAEFLHVPTTRGIADVAARNAREASRTGRYLRDVGELAENTLDGPTFRRRWRGKGAGGYTFEHDPDRVLAMLREQGPGPVERYRRNPAGGTR
jgi:hypothetical protein